MHFALLALILGSIFGVLATLVVWIAKGEATPAMGIIGGGAFVAGFLVSLTQFWYSLPTWGTVIVVGLLLGGIMVIVMLRLFSKSFGRLGRSPEKIIVLIVGILLIVTPAYFGLSAAIYRGYDTARYFDTVLEFPEGELPFNNIVTGDHLRVVDSDLAEEIIQKSSPFGSNTMILEMHVGKIYGKLMWIGVIGTDSVRIGTDNAERKRNSIFGFVGVDLTDPGADVVVVEQPFTIGHYLARSKLLNRIIWKFNPNYRAGDNSYFSMNDEDQMRLLVPYSISHSLTVENVNGIAMTTYLEKVGGVLEFDSLGNLVKDHTELEDLPHYARIQCYPENWLEYNINKWGRHRKGNHEFQYFFTTTEQLGISWYDDVRVIYDANTGETSQYVMLTQPESESQLLRGAIKANGSGIFFFDWSDLQPKPIDTYNALIHCATAIDIHPDIATTEHNYRPILPLLYPVRDTFQNISDYAYVVPIQFEQLRFGGIAITNPLDTSGIETIVELAEISDTVETVLIRALDRYLIMLGDEGIATSNYTETLEIEAITSFEQDGDTIYVAYGNLTYLPEGEVTPVSENQTVWFTQHYLNLTYWEQVLFLEAGDVLKLEVFYLGNVFYCRSIVSIN
ncbi:MAG: hypothetical protein ACTSQ0_01950 [Candidatus Heimdallarchaeota archaeon]